MENTRVGAKTAFSNWVLRFLAIILLLLLIAIMTFKAVKMYEAESETRVPPVFKTDDDDVPNIVHFIRFGNKTVTFLEAVCMLAALKNQKPDKIYVHTDHEGTFPTGFWGRFWDVVVGSPSAKGVVEVKHLELPTTIFGKKIDERVLYFHAGDYARIGVLMKYGGIYLDNDSYIVKNLSEFFKHEMTFGWNGRDVFNQVLIAKKSARFLRLWRESFVDYRPHLWYYNGGYLPGQLVRKVPTWVHTVPHFLAEYSTYVTRMLYYWDTGVWKQHFAIHLLANHTSILRKDRLTLAGVTYPVDFDETNILKYPINLRQMALDVYPYGAAVLEEFGEIYPHLPRPEDRQMTNYYEGQTESELQISYLNRVIEAINRTYELERKNFSRT